MIFYTDIAVTLFLVMIIFKNLKIFKFFVSFIKFDAIYINIYVPIFILYLMLNKNFFIDVLFLIQQLLNIIFLLLIINFVTNNSINHFNAELLKKPRYLSLKKHISFLFLYKNLFTLHKMYLSTYINMFQLSNFCLNNFFIKLKNISYSFQVQDLLKIQFFKDKEHLIKNELNGNSFTFGLLCNKKMKEKIPAYLPGYNRPVIIYFYPKVTDKNKIEAIINKN